MWLLRVCTEVKLFGLARNGLADCVLFCLHHILPTAPDCLFWLSLCLFKLAQSLGLICRTFPWLLDICVLVFRLSDSTEIEIESAWLLLLIKLKALRLLLLELDFSILLCLVVLKLRLRFHLSMKVRKANVIYPELKVVTVLHDHELVTLTFEMERESGIKMLFVSY